jgi:amidohydrolase
MSDLDAKQIARERAHRAHPTLIGLSHFIQANPELGFEEEQAADGVAEVLDKAGFEVTRGLGEMATALAGSFGEGPLHVALLAEYDALPEVGHACGHNIIAATAVGAGVALAGVAHQLGMRVSVIGTPAEENGGGKIRLIEAGVFEDVHLALMVHPGPSDVLAPEVLAAETLEVTYRGQSSHAASFPERGANAADAMVVAQVALGLLRQRMGANDRLHGIVTSGGAAENVIPEHVTGRFMIRSTSPERMASLRKDVMHCFEAGAKATGTKLTVESRPAYREMTHDAALVEAYRRNAEELGRTFDADGRIEFRHFSSDIGNVSQVVPAIHPILGIGTNAVNHTPDFTAATVAAAADQAILDGAVALAWTAIDAATDQALRERLLGGSAAGG